MGEMDQFGQIMTMLRATLQASVIAAAGNQVILRELAAIQVALAQPAGTTDEDETMHQRALLIENASLAQEESVNQLWSGLGLLQMFGPGPRINVHQQPNPFDPQ